MQINTQQRIQRKDAFVLSLHYENNKKNMYVFKKYFLQINVFTNILCIF